MRLISVQRFGDYAVDWERSLSVGGKMEWVSGRVVWSQLVMAGRG